MTKLDRVKFIIDKLSLLYPNPRTALEYLTPLELLIATILSAQCTDKVVNNVTPELFKRFSNAKAFADADVSDIDKYISKVTFHSNKAKNIKAASEMIVEMFNGEVPDNMEDLDSLPGVARKTANVVLGDAFKKPSGVVVDTHVMRLSQKFGLTEKKDPEKIEKDLMELVPKEEWVNFAHYLILHGRECCTARGSKPDCPIKDLYS